MQPDDSTKPVVVREPDASKGARPVLRGEGGREASFLPSMPQVNQTLHRAARAPWRWAVAWWRILYLGAVVLVLVL